MSRRPLPRDAVSLDLPGELLRDVTEKCARFAIRQVETIGAQPSWDHDGVEAIAASFREPPPEHGGRIDALLRRLEAAVAKSLNSAGPGYLAYIPGGGVYPAALGDFLALTVNRYVGIAAPAPALSQIERTVIDWLRQLVGYPEGAQGILTSGGSLSNLTAIVTARRTRLPENFLSGVVYLSEQAHHSVPKAALLAGFPEANLRALPVDARWRMLPGALETAIRDDRARGLQPFLVVASAGTTNTGAIDPVPEIADICGRERLWLHVDGAYGGFFRMAPGGDRLLPGLERADSLTLDPHKGLFLPYGTGLLLVRDPDALRRAHQSRATYLQDLHGTDLPVSFSDISPELSREFRGLRLWLPLKLLGVAAFRDNLREKLELARWAWEELRRERGFECLDEPQLSVVPFRYVPKAGDPDAFNARLMERVHAARRVFLSSTSLDGTYALRLCVLSFRTHGDRMAMAVEDLVRSARELERGG